MLNQIEDMISDNVFMILFLIAPFFSLFEIIKSIKVLFDKDSIYLNYREDKIYKDKRAICNFNEVQFIQIRTISGDEGSDSHRLSIVFGHNQKLRIEQLSDFDKICEISDFLGDLLKVKVIKK